MGTLNGSPAPSDPPSRQPPNRDWLDLTLKLATSWVGLFSAYAIAVLVALTKFKELTQGLHDIGVKPWLGITLITALPLLALVFSTIPKFIEERRIKGYSEIKGGSPPGYFTLRPRDDEEHFERADNAHQEVLRWLENSTEPVLYLTGASGTGKSSLLSAWVLPKLKREGHVVVQIRGYEGGLLARIQAELLQPDVVWERPPAKIDDVRSLLQRAVQRLRQSDNQRRLFIVVDQFEEFLILTGLEKQDAFRQFLTENPTGGLTFLLVYRPEYEGFLEDQPWPKLKLDINRKSIKAFTENAAQEFLRKSGLIVDADLTRTVLREAAEIDQTPGLMRPVTINISGLVLSRFASGLPRRFRGGIIRGFLRESLSLPEVRDVAGKLIPQLITSNVTKQPRTVADLAQATLVAPAAVRAGLRRLGESDRAIVRPLDQQQETWEISHDFLVPLLDGIVARRTVSWWRAFRPWLPWTAAAAIRIAAVLVPLMGRQDPRLQLTRQGWTVSEEGGLLHLFLNQNVPRSSLPILLKLPPPLSLSLTGVYVTDISALRDLGNLTSLDLNFAAISQSAAENLRDLKNLTSLNLSETRVTDVSALKDLSSLASLALAGTQIKDISVLKNLTRLSSLDLSYTPVTDISVLRDLSSLTSLNLTAVGVADLSALKGLKNLTSLNLSQTPVTDVSALKNLSSLAYLDLNYTPVIDISPLKNLKNLTELNLFGTSPVGESALKEELKGLRTFP